MKYIKHKNYSNYFIIIIASKVTTTFIFFFFKKELGNNPTCKFY